LKGLIRGSHWDACRPQPLSNSTDINLNSSLSHGWLAGDESHPKIQPNSCFSEPEGNEFVDIHRHSSLQRRWLLNTHGLAESSHGTLAVFVNPVASSCSPNLSIDQIPSSLTTKRASYMLISQASGIINTNLHKHQIVLSIVKNDIHHDIETSQS
jgi:hypothetical protein